MDDEFEIFELNEEAKPYKISHRCYVFFKRGDQVCEGM